MTQSPTLQIVRIPPAERPAPALRDALWDDLDARIVGGDTPGAIGVQVRPVVLEIPRVARRRPIPMRPRQPAPQPPRRAPALAESIAAVLAVAIGLEQLASRLVCAC